MINITQIIENAQSSYTSEPVSSQALQNFTRMVNLEIERQIAEQYEDIVECETCVMPKIQLDFAYHIEFGFSRIVIRRITVV